MIPTARRVGRPVDRRLMVSDGVKDTSLKAKTKDLKIVLEDPRGRGLVLEDSNTANGFVHP